MLNHMYSIWMNKFNQTSYSLFTLFLLQAQKSSTSGLSWWIWKIHRWATHLQKIFHVTCWKTTRRTSISIIIRIWRMEPSNLRRTTIITRRMKIRATDGIRCVDHRKIINLTWTCKVLQTAREEFSCNFFSFLILVKLTQNRGKKFSLLLTKISAEK